MIDYKGLECPICHKKLDGEDDAVYCPKCGCPHHRACWHELGQCAFHDAHGTKNQWQKPSADDSSKKEEGPSSLKCPRCGYENPSDVRLCLNCSLDIDRGEPTPGFAGRRPEPDKNTLYEDSPVLVQIDPLGGVPPHTPIEGVPAGDVALFVQTQTPYYIPRFSRLSSGNRWASFNPSAFMLTGIWFLYRKMYLLGAVLFSLFMLLYSGVLIIQTKVLYPITSKYEGLTSYEIVNRFLEEATPRQIGLVYVSVFLMGATAILMLFCGLFANRIYMNRSLKKIRQANRDAADAEDFKRMLKEQGGINVKAALMSIACYIIISYGVQMILM